MAKKPDENPNPQKPATTSREDTDTEQVDLSALFDEETPTMAEGGAAESPETKELPKQKKVRVAPETMSALPELEEEAPKSAARKTKSPAAPTTHLAPTEEVDDILSEATVADAAKKGGKTAPASSTRKTEVDEDIFSLPEQAGDTEQDAEDVADSKVDLGASSHVGHAGPSPLDTTSGSTETGIPGVQDTTGATEEPIGFGPDEPQGGDIPDEPEPDDVDKPKKSKMRTVALGAGGVLVGGVACVALAVFNVLPIDALKEMAGTAPAKPAVTQRSPNTNAAPAQPSASPVSGSQLFDYGDFAKAAEELGKVEQPDADVLTKRGLARWFGYVQQKKQTNAALSKDEEAVAAAKKDLGDANTPEAKFWLGHIEEHLAGPAAARAIYQEGLKQANKPEQQRLFQSALDRLDATAGAPAGNKETRLPGGVLPAESPLAFMLSSMALVQAEGAGPAAEAGFDFWKAAKLAREHKYDEALTALQQARAAHDLQRYLRLRQSQNPTSDPTEMIFLRACDELAAYWRIRQALVKDGYMAANASADPVKILVAVLKDAKGGKGSGDALTALADRLKKDKDVSAAVPDAKDVPRAVGVLLQAKSRIDGQVAELRTALEGAKYVSPQQTDVAAGLQKLLKDQKDASSALAEAAKVLKDAKHLTDGDANVAAAIAKAIEAKKNGDNQLAQANDKLVAANGVIQEVVKRLTAAKYTDAKADQGAIVKALDSLIGESATPAVAAIGQIAGSMASATGQLGARAANQINLADRLAASQANNLRLQAEIRQARTPREMLGLWLPILKDGDRADLAEKAARDAQAIIKDASSDAETKAKALGVEGLALLNQGRLDDARKALASALQGDTIAKADDWRVQIKRTLETISDPSAHYLPEAIRLQSAGKAKEALAVINRGLTVFAADGKNRGQFHALHSRFTIDEARASAKGLLDIKDPRVAAATADAQSALKDGATAAGNYALGYIAEATGDVAGAIRHYEQALSSHAANDAAGNRYRLAVARLLVRIYAAPASLEGQISRLLDGDNNGISARRLGWHGNPLAALAMLFVLTDDAVVADATATPELDRAMRLADEAIQSGANEGYMVKAMGLAAKKRWNEAIRVYIDGLQKLNPSPEQAQILRYIMDNHPAFKVPDGLTPPKPLVAEQHFAAGLRAFWQRDYTTAAKELESAVHNYDQDARYLYFLGLTQFLQGKSDSAQESFRRANLLERQSKPAREIISASLERVQGFGRKELNRHRP